MQRVALARAMAIEPDVLLLDEPAANLDPANVARVEAFIRDAQARGTTIVLVTHNTHEARRLAHRTLLLIEGAVVETGPTAAFFESPADAQNARLPGRRTRLLIRRLQAAFDPQAGKPAGHPGASSAQVSAGSIPATRYAAINDVIIE